MPQKKSEQCAEGAQKKYSFLLGRLGETRRGGCIWLDVEEWRLPGTERGDGVNAEFQEYLGKDSGPVEME